MALSQADKEYRSFIAGLITEATPLTYPENSVSDINNFDLNINGSIRRRPGMEYEPSHALQTLSFPTSVFDQQRITSFRWDNAGGSAAKTIFVFNIGEQFYFFDGLNAAPSSSLITSVSLTGSFVAAPSYTVAGGKLYIGGSDRACVWEVEYNATSGDISGTLRPLLTRDVWGTDDGLEVDERPLSLTDEHNYNLKNQGWFQDVPCDESGIQDPIEFTFDATPVWGGSAGTETDIGAYPSNADIWFVAKDTENEYQPSKLQEITFGNYGSPKGHYIISVANRQGWFGASGPISFTNSTVSTGTNPADNKQRRSASGVVLDLSNLDYDINAHVTATAGYAGRVFYAINKGGSSLNSKAISTSPDLESLIFFSKILENKGDATKCYQQQDPSAEYTSDLLASDGGFISIPEMNQPRALVPLNDSLLILAENGVWAINGADSPFAADNTQVSKISDIGVNSRGSVVLAESLVFYWNKGGIYVIGASNVGGFSVESLTETTIQSFYTSIPSVGRLYSRGVFDAATKRVHWLYNDDSGYDGVSLRDKYNKELIFDIRLKAFYVHSYTLRDAPAPYICGMITTPEYVSTTYNENVVDLLGAVVTANDATNVTVSRTARGVGASNIKYWVVLPNNANPASLLQVTLAYKYDTTFKDFTTYDSTGLDSAAYLLTSPELLEDSQRQKQAKYLTWHMKRTETGFTDDGSGNLSAINPSSCLVQPYWDFADTTASGKIGTQFQAYKLERNYIPTGVGDTFNYGQNVITTKNKLRGRGRALAIRVDTEAANDCHIYGWAVSYTGGSNV